MDLRQSALRASPRPLRVRRAHGAAGVDLADLLSSLMIGPLVLVAPVIAMDVVTPQLAAEIATGDGVEAG